MGGLLPSCLPSKQADTHPRLTLIKQAFDLCRTTRPHPYALLNEPSLHIEINKDRGLSALKVNMKEAARFLSWVVKGGEGEGVWLHDRPHKVRVF